MHLLNVRIFHDIDRVIAPGGHLVTDRSEFRGGQQAARHRKQFLVFNGDVTAV